MSLSLFIILKKAEIRLMTTKCSDHLTAYITNCRSGFTGVIMGENISIYNQPIKKVKYLKMIIALY
jgi:hypothetical protein